MLQSGENLIFRVCNLVLVVTEQQAVETNKSVALSISTWQSVLSAEVLTPSDNILCSESVCRVRSAGFAGDF